MRALIVTDLGRMSYADALAVQRQRHADVVAGRDDGGPMHLLLVEHAPPVITVSRRRTSRDHLLASPEALARDGIEVAETDRGGDITYHGPGQLVVYPILDLNALGLRLHGYMRFLEAVVIETLALSGVEGHRDPEATGVWVGSAPQDRKICAMGVRLSRWVALHGLALNVSTDLEHYRHIVPCGIADRAVTSLERETVDAPCMARVKEDLVTVFRRAISELGAAYDRR